MSSEQIRLRTDVVLSSNMGVKPPLIEYLSALDNNEITKQDIAALSTAVVEESPYTMRDLEQPIPPSEMVIPQNLQEYLAGHTKVATSYLSDWPVASPDNRFGEHHPFGMKSNCCPLLHGAAHGNPEYVEHTMRFMDMLDNHHESERMLNLSQEEKMLFGSPSMTMKDHYAIDRERSGSYYNDDEWKNEKRADLSENYGLLPHLFGLEFQNAEQRETFLNLLSDLANSESLDSVEAKVAKEKMQEKAGITWDRALRNWRGRYTPLAAWWSRPSDRSGPTAAHDGETGSDDIISPYTPIGEGHNYHWWQPYQYWGGVGRDLNSLRQVFSQSYPKIFSESWLTDFLLHQIPIDGAHMGGGSHFPVKSNEYPELNHILSSASGVGFQDFQRRRSNWSHAANQHHLHPSEIVGQGGRMIIPSDAMKMSRFGRSLLQVSEMGSPMIGMFRSGHPNSNTDFHDIHNQHFLQSDDEMVLTMAEMAKSVYSQFGPDVLAPSDIEDIQANTIARGNIQQLAAAANYQLMRGEQFQSPNAKSPMVERGGVSMSEGGFGPVHPSSGSVVPPIFNTGNTDAWGHLMPATLAWRWNTENNEIEFALSETPFEIMQRTAHEGMVKAADLSYESRKISTKPKEINALSPNQYGYPSLTMDLHKSDDYEPTGVFNKTIEPAHVLKDIGDIDDIKGFSGDWIVQAKPNGKHLLVKKKGRKIEPTNLPNDIKKDLKDITGDFIFDAYLDDKTLNVVDLLLHKGTDMHMETLEDRINALKTLYQTTENIHFPSPANCNSADSDGLMKTIASMKNEDLLLRDSTSTFMKGKEVHPKWVLYAQTDVSKSKIHPPLPEIEVRDSSVLLHYPSIYNPVIAKLSSDDNGTYIEEYNGSSYLVKNAKDQFSLWSPVVASILKEGGGVGGGAAGASSGGTVTSSTAGTYNAIHSIKPKKRKLKKAPEVNDEDTDDISDIMTHARKAITVDDKALTTKELISKVDGLNEKMLELYAGEYGLERTEDGRWTVNEAIDDDVIENFAFPRMNRASADGGAWSGMQADITAPTGPTELVDESATTFADPKNENREGEHSPQFKPMRMEIQTEEGPIVIEFKDDVASVKIPPEKKNENDVLQTARIDEVV